MGERDRGVPYGGNEETFWITQARGNPGGKEITMDEIKLKPCPFCGGEAMLTTNLYAGIVYIQCKCCTAMVGRKRNLDMRLLISNAHPRAGAMWRNSNGLT